MAPARVLDAMRNAIEHAPPVARWHGTGWRHVSSGVIVCGACSARISARSFGMFPVPDWDCAQIGTTCALCAAAIGWPPR